MQGPQNTFTLDFRDNPELKNAFATKKVGEKCTFTVTAQIDDMDDEKVTGTIEEIEPEGYEDPNAEKGQEGKVSPDSDSPVMLVMRMGKSGAKTKGGQPPSDNSTE